jgi:ankyrin repeat protein
MPPPPPLPRALQAAQGGDAEMCEWLIASGADLLAANDAGSTPLHLAASAGQVVPSMVLIAAGAPLDARDGSQARVAPTRGGQLPAQLQG